MDPWISGLFALLGVGTAGRIQYVILRQKAREDAEDKIRERQVQFSADVAQHLRLMRNIKSAQDKNHANGKVVPVSQEKSDDLSVRYRAVVASAYALMGCGDVDLAKKAELFLNEFESYVDGHPDVTTGAGDFRSQQPVEDYADEVRKHQPLLPRRSSRKK
jgi:hypothetical protein